MPRYFCDYCDAYLTHDSAPGRQQHIRGWKHRENFRLYYQQHLQQWIADQQLKRFQEAQQYESQMAMMMQAGMVCPPAGGPLSGPPVPPGHPGPPMPMSMPMPPPGAPMFRPPPSFAPPPAMPPPQPAAPF